MIELLASLLLVAATADGSTLAAGGLTMEIDGATGALRSVSALGEPLPLIPGVAGGFSVREWRPIVPVSERPLARLDFEGREGWVAVSGGNWSGKGPTAVEHRTDGGGAGTRGYVRLGHPQRLGDGVGVARPMKVEADHVYETAWQGRSSETSSSFIVYIRVFDAAGKDITPDVPAPDGWTYSPFSKTHYQASIAASQGWGKISRRYQVPTKVVGLRIAVCLWRGEHVDADELEVREVGGTRPVSLVIPAARPTPLANGAGYEQRASSHGDQLEYRWRYQAASGYLNVEGEIRDTSNPPRSRALEVRYVLPARTDGWWWHDDLRRRRAIEGNEVYGNDFGYCGHRVSRYPFASVTTAGKGLAMAVPMDYPCLQSWSASRAEGFRATWNLAAAAGAAPQWRSRTEFRLALYTVDPRWGFRSAAKRYYEIFPESFTKRARREGAWLWPVPPAEIPEIEDFGLAFWEVRNPTTAAAKIAREHGLAIMGYVEPCGIRQWYAAIREASGLPSEGEAIAQLRTVAADEKATQRWHGGPAAPQREVAQAILNSLPRTDGEKALHPVSNEYDHWARHWFTNPSPHLARPNRGQLAWTYEILPWLEHGDGVYVDSVEVWQTNYNNLRSEHLAAAQGPVSFDRRTAEPSVPASLAYRDFLDWLGAELHTRGKLLMLNVFAEPPAYRFYAHLGDVLGSEVSSRWRPGKRTLAEVEADEACCLRRTYAYRKPTVNLLQDGDWKKPVPAISNAQVEQYFQHQLFYGFYPGISTIGGETRAGYAGWKRYFRSSEQFNRDRGLFRKYLPLIGRINAAGWEPITHARAEQDRVWIERFGSSPGELFFTVRNGSAEARRARVAVDLAGLGIATSQQGSLSVEELVLGRPVEMRVEKAQGEGWVELDMPGQETRVLRFHRRNDGR